jgi:hypothetical protein
MLLFDAQKLIKEIVNPPEFPPELVPSVDPWTLPTEIGVASEMPVVAVEVGGAGTGTWVWVSAIVAANPIAASILAVIAISAVVGTFWWAESTPKNTPVAEIDARGNITPNPRLEIANNSLPDNPQPFLDAAKNSQPTAESRPSFKGGPTPQQPKYSGGSKPLIATGDLSGVWVFSPDVIETFEKLSATSYRVTGNAENETGIVSETRPGTFEGKLTSTYGYSIASFRLDSPVLLHENGSYYCTACVDNGVRTGSAVGHRR